MIKSNTERFIGRIINHKFERKNCIYKICGMSIYRNLSALLFFLLGFTAVLSAQPEVTQSGDLYYVKLIDGFNGVLMYLPQANNAEVIFYVKTGSMYEGDSISGTANLLVKIFNQKLAAGIKSGKSQLSVQNTGFEGYSTTERAVFKFTTPSKNLNACMALFRDSVLNGKIYNYEIAPVRNIILQQLEDAKHDKKKMFEQQLLDGLYVQDHQKLEIQGNAAVINDIGLSTLTNFFKKYYVPSNSIVTFTGNFQSLEVEDAMQKIFKPVPKSAFNPETVTKIVDMRPMTYNTQFIADDTTTTPEFEICWQFPGTNSNFEESYSAFLLNAMLNDKNNYIQVKVAKMGCKKFVVQYEANNFNGILRIIMQPSKQNFVSTYRFVINEMGRLNKTLLNDVMINAGKLEFKKEYNNLKKTKEFPHFVVKHWTFNNETYFPTLLDSVMAAEPKVLEIFTVNYLNQSPYITGLKISKADREAMQVDTAFTDLNRSVGKYVFTYKQNVTNLEGADNDLKLHNLLQWLIINPDINVQVNGFSDEHEYNQATDKDSIITFIDSMPTFHKVTSEIIKKKRTIRPELARAAKIVRYLYDHGIAAERLNGTAMMFKSSNKKEAADNMKCTITLNKQRKGPSLYEYHYGKKKE